MTFGRRAVWILLLVLALPIAVFLFMYNFTQQNFTRLPYEHDLIENGDSVFHRIPDVVFTDLNGRSFPASELEGNLVFLDFFTLRQDSLKLTAVLHGNLKRTHDNVMWERNPPIRFVSISTGDQLEELQAHASSLEAEAPGWQIVTVSQEDLLRLGDAFQIPDFSKQMPGQQPFTSQTVVFLDKEGYARKYFTGTDLAEERKMQEDLITLFRLEYPDDLSNSRDQGQGLLDYLKSNKL